MPLAIPVVALHPELEIMAENHSFYAAAVAAVFSGAVFGDHCSPLSDTTLVSAFACGIEPHEHVRTQMPFALLAATVAAVIGFLPAGLGLNPAWLMLLGIALIVIISKIFADKALQ